MLISNYNLIGALLVWAIDLYVMVLWGRLIVDWVQVLARGFQPRGFVLLLFVLIVFLTDKPIRAIRNILPPVRIGPVAIDVAWLVLMFACYIGRWLILIII